MLAKAFKSRLLNSNSLIFAQRSFTAKIVHEPLPYELSALEPVITGTQMDFHYNKHHKTYVTKYNEKLDQVQEALAKNDTTRIARLAREIRFFGGGNYNHTFFWDSLAPVAQGGGVKPAEGSELSQMIKQQWGSYENFITFFNAESASIQGSGWGWLVYCKSSKSLEYRSSVNQDLITDVQSDLVPLMNIDVWEHAYYLDYKHARADFLKEVWKIVNW